MTTPKVRGSVKENPRGGMFDLVASHECEAATDRAGLERDSANCPPQATAGWSSSSADFKRCGRRQVSDQGRTSADIGDRRGPGQVLAFLTIAAATHRSGRSGPVNVATADGADLQEASLSDRKERILALEELHAMGILHRDEFVAEMKAVTDPQPRLVPRSPELPAHRQRGQGARTRCAWHPRTIASVRTSAGPAVSS